jgi:hypothetical protein
MRTVDEIKKVDATAIGPIRRPSRAYAADGIALLVN